jgi:hypothetical protein
MKSPARDGDNAHNFSTAGADAGAGASICAGDAVMTAD